jgi:dTDP-glucose pyrophosphorylase
MWRLPWVVHSGWPLHWSHPVKGIILAGVLGTRLFPLTKITNKHLLPGFDRPMIYYPIECLVNAGITDIMSVTGGKKSGDFLSLLGNGEDFGLKHLNYTYQKGEGGIADALGLCEHWAASEPVCVILGDNIIETLKPSDRGELEITDVNNWFLDDGSMTYDVLDGWWTDAGTFDSLIVAAGLCQNGGANQTASSIRTCSVPG